MTSGVAQHRLRLPWTMISERKYRATWLRPERTAGRSYCSHDCLLGRTTSVRARPMLGSHRHARYQTAIYSSTHFSHPQYRVEISLSPSQSRLRSHPRGKAKVPALFCPTHRGSRCDLGQGKVWRLSSIKNCFDDVRSQEGAPNDHADVTLVEACRGSNRPTAK